MPEMTPDEIDALLREPQIAVLSTANAKGRPEGSPVWFHYDGTAFRVLVHRDSRKARNVRENPQVSVTIDTRSAPYRGIVFRGIARLSGPNPKFRRDLAHRYLGSETGERYLAATRAMDTEDALVTIDVKSSYSWDYSKGF
ncbi:MAG: TIGR03618 family F420-dependent PPOX class oxidoreductase [Myxococcales bacterium]|nr:MAG: TIGR03618 family F420-dependent PPOX class oxidoreductase [Myxococcales bacterium]